MNGGYRFEVDTPEFRGMCLDIEQLIDDRTKAKSVMIKCFLRASDGWIFKEPGADGAQMETQYKIDGTTIVPEQFPGVGIERIAEYVWKFHVYRFTIKPGTKDLIDHLWIHQRHE